MTEKPLPSDLKKMLKKLKLRMEDYKHFVSFGDTKIRRAEYECFKRLVASTEVELDYVQIFDKKHINNYLQKQRRNNRPIPQELFVLDPSF